MTRYFYLVISIAIASIANAQHGYWQQRAEYVMDIDFDVTKHQYKGKQKLTYFNNSPDTLYKVFYHLYFNAFQPGSVMDVRNRTIQDPQKNIGDRISKLRPEEQGYQKINSLKQNGTEVKFTTQGTILEVELDKPILPGKKATFEMDFDAQVPLQIRRSGRNNAEGIDYSMAQWYPKMCEYDVHGWHANEYIGREFYGIWGDFEVSITIDSNFIIGGTGYLQNANEIGHGYEAEGAKIKRTDGKKLTWEFKAPNVHDFVWAADPDYVVKSRKCQNGVMFYFVYENNDTLHQTWGKLGEYMEKALNWMNSHYGEYPYKQYSFVQGGDGGMEYPMATLITGKRGFSSLVGVSVHEMNHSWFQGVLAFDESHYGWMDEGFTSYTSDEVMNHLGYDDGEPLFFGGYKGYWAMTEAKLDEPLTTHADFYNSNGGYGSSVYNKGGVFLHQLRYIVGETNYQTGMLRFYNEWKFKHPDATALKRVMEKVSGLELDWYFEQWVNTTNTIDYAVKSFYTTKNKTNITLERKGKMMMPLEVLVRFADGSSEWYYIPLTLMRGTKTDFGKVKVNTLADWQWVNPFYTIEIDGKKEVAQIIIDPGYYLADTERDNNAMILPDDAEIMIEGK
ncbi:MAG: M1 family metallopeptidase [Bacteroidota bacterium]